MAHNDEWDAINAGDFAEISDGVSAATGEPGGVRADATDSVETFFAAHGLAKYAKDLVEATDAESVEDLRLLDDTMVDSLVRSLGLKLVSAEKLRLAVRSLTGGTSGTCATEAMSTGEAAGGGAYARIPVKLEECIAICIDRSGSMGTPFAELTINVVKGEERDPLAMRTRMEAVKAMFYAFRDRLESAGGPGRAQLGLLQYDNEFEVMLGLTDRLEQFERVLDDMHKRGQTAIYSSIVEASRMLEPVFHSNPEVDLRILVLTDGQNNSGATALAALDAANRIGAVVDAIIVGDRPDSDLRRIVAVTGGQCYQIQHLGAGFELLEADTVVSLRARRGGGDKPPFVPRATPPDLGKIEQLAMIQSVTSTAAAGTSTQPAGPVVTASAVVGKVTPCASNAAVVRRALAELRQIANRSSGAALLGTGGGEGVHIFPCESDLTFWRVLIEGPVDTPFEGGVFALTVRLPDEYPLKPPEVRFATPVYHCNMNEAGAICLDLLKEGWSPALSILKVMQAIRLLLAKPDTENALRQWIAELTSAHNKHGAADTRYIDEARVQTAKDASRSVAQWKAEWGCADA